MPLRQWPRIKTGGLWIVVFAIERPRLQCWAIASKAVIGQKAETPKAWCNRDREMENPFRASMDNQTCGGIPCHILGMKIEYFTGLLGSALTMLTIVAD